MTEIEKQIIDTWFINHRTNLLLLDSLTEESLSFSTSKRGGGNVGHQLAHIYNVRFWWLEKFDKSLTTGLSAIKSEDNKSIQMLKDAHILSAELIGKMLNSGIENGKVKGYKRGVVTLLSYFINHEAHHRGNIILTLKLSGFKLDNILKYKIWEWDKI